MATNQAGWGRPDTVSSRGGDERGGDRELEKTFSAVRTALSRHRDVASWRAVLTTTRSDELYLIREQVESERRGHGHSIDVEIRTRNGSEVGRASFSVGPGEDTRIDGELGRAIDVAKKSGVPEYQIPDPAPLPTVETVDREIADHPQRTLESLRGELVDTLAKERKTQVASAEFFVLHDMRRMEDSRGMVADLSGTRSTAEVVLLGRGAQGREAEVQDLRRRRTSRDLEVGRWVSGLAEEAQSASEAEPMTTWRGPVVLRANVLGAYFGPLVRRLGGDSVYREMSPYSIGDVVSSADVRGDRLTLATDRTLPFGLATAPCDGDGIPAARDVLVQDGRIERFWADARFAYYLGIEPTGGWSNLVIEPGIRSASDLLSGEEVLEVVRFSWFTPNRGTGDFATEMRMGYLHRGGRRIPVKGGAVTGNAFAALGHAFFSRETEFVGDGRVPHYLRLEGLDVAGV